MINGLKLVIPALVIDWAMTNRLDGQNRLSGWVCVTSKSNSERITGAEGDNLHDDPVSRLLDSLDALPIVEPFHILALSVLCQSSRCTNAFTGLNISNAWCHVFCPGY